MSLANIITLVSASVYFIFLLSIKRDSMVDAIFSVLIFLILLIWLPVAKYFLIASLIIFIYELVKEIFG